MFQDAHSHVVSGTSAAVLLPYWSPDEKAEAINSELFMQVFFMPLGLDILELKTFIHRLFSSGFLEMFVHGNTTEEVSSVPVRLRPMVLGSIECGFHSVAVTAVSPTLTHTNSLFSSCGGNS